MLSRITEHRNHNRFLSERYGAAARNAISKHNSYIRALRSVYNDVAPVNQRLPSEVLMEVFSYINPAVTAHPLARVSVLRVCGY